MAPRKGRGKGRQAVRNNSGGTPGWIWAIVGILAGALLMAFALRGTWMPMLHKNDGPQPNAQATAQRGSEPGVVDQAEPAADKPKKPTYDFYSVLSEKEVRIPDAEISAQARAEAQQRQQQAAQQQQATQAAAAVQQAKQPASLAQTPAETVVAAPPAAVAPVATANSANGYLLQVGAFPSAGDAETLKAKLALQGFVANVQSVKVGGQTYNRVRLGPFRSASELESTKQRLSSAGISAIALKESN
jgi:cell division protein FtsN